MKYAIIGTGAIGGYYGGMLAKAGNEVHFLLRSDYDYVTQHGLQVNTPSGNFHLDNIHAYNNTNEMPPCDVILVCLKTTANQHLKQLLQPLVSHPSAPTPLVILIQNGIGVEQDVQTMFPDLQLAAGLAFICSAKTKPGIVDHQDYGQINIGNYSADKHRINDLVVDLNKANIQAAEVDYTTARWKKAVWNMPFNGLTVALNTQTDILLRTPSTRQLVRDLMYEVITAGRAQGADISYDFIDTMINMTDSMTPYSPSMKLDFDFHRPMEINYIYTRPTDIAAQAGTPMPKLKMLEQQLLFLQSLHTPTS